MLERLTVRKFTVFADADFRFSPGLNVIVGENGAGKTHVLKLAYASLATCWEEGRKPNALQPTKAVLQTRLAEKLVNVFRPEALGRLARRKQGRERCEVALQFKQPALNMGFGFASNSKSEVGIEQMPSEWLSTAPAYLPTRELLTIYPNFVATYENHYLQFEETWRDTCLLLGAPLARGPKERGIRTLLEPLEQAMDGSIELDGSGRFYLHNAEGRIEIPLVAEGIRKLAMLARLIATGMLSSKGYLFWDEPEANLNPRLIRKVAESIVGLASAGIQVFLATHSLFLLRELEILLGKTSEAPKARFFGLHRGADGVTVKQGADIADMGDIAALDEELEQSDRFLAQEAEHGA